MGNQWVPFHQASEILELSAGVKFIYLTCHDVNKRHMTEEDIIHDIYMHVKELLL